MPGGWDAPKTARAGVVTAPGTSPRWLPAGGIAHGPRGPTSYFYMVPMRVRVAALKVALTVKLMQVRGCPRGGVWGRSGVGDRVTGVAWSLQDDLHVVDTLEVPTSDPRYLLELAGVRRWGQSVLVVDV